MRAVNHLSHRHRSYGTPDDALAQALAGEDQHRGYASDHQLVRRLASGVGRKSGKVYRTPVNVFRVPDAFIIALTYSSECEWVNNVLATDGCELKTRGKKYQLSAPNVVRDPSRRRFLFPVRIVLKSVGADEYMELLIAK